MTFGHEESVEAVRAFFDEFAAGEWERLDSDALGRVNFEVHLAFMTQFIEPGMRVLEIGAGPGRFTAPLVELGATVTVTDISRVQLDLNEKYMTEAGAAPGIEDRFLLDVSDTAAVQDGSFDAVLAYGGPLSYVFDKAEEALDGLFRITRRGGPVIASVMSTLGGYRFFFPAVVETGKEFGEDANDRIVETGDLRETQPPGSGLHTCKMFRSDEIAAMVDRLGADMLAMSASNWASLGDQEVLEELASDQERWGRYVLREIWAGSQPGAIDGGTHLMFAASRG